MWEESLKSYVMASDVIVPADLLEETFNQMYAEAFHRMRYEYMARGRTLKPKEIEQLSEEVKCASYLQAKTHIVLNDIIKKEALEISRAELEDEARAIAERQQLSFEEVRNFFGKDLAPLKDDLLLRKAIDFITGQTAFKEREVRVTS